MTVKAKKEFQGIKASLSQPRVKAMLDKAHGAVGRLYPYFLLEFFLVRITCSATDLQIGIVAEMSTGEDASVEMGGRICVPAAKLRDLVNALPDAPIQFTGLEGNKLRVDCGDYSGVLPGFDPDEHFPAMERPSEDSSFVCDGDILQAIYGACSHSMYKNDGITNSLFVQMQKGRLHGVATDGHRLSLAAKAVDDEGGDKLQKGLILSSRLLGKIPLLSPHTCEISIGDTAVALDQQKISLIGRLLEGEYPDFRKVIPTNHPYSCIVKAREFADIVERVQILSESDNIILDLAPGHDDDVAGDIQISAENSAGIAQDLIAAEIAGDPVQIRVTPRYLVEALRSLGRDSEDVVIKYHDPLAPMVLIPADHSAWDERVELIMTRVM